MRFSITATLFTLASSVLAEDMNPTAGFNAIVKPAQSEKVPAGSTYDIIWDYDPGKPSWAGTITVSLLGGDNPATLSVLNVIASGVDQTKGKLAWAVDKSLGSKATYGIMIALDSNSKIFQYGFPFQITGAAVGPSSASVSNTYYSPSRSPVQPNPSVFSPMATTTTVGPVSNVSSLPTMVTPPVQLSNLSTTLPGVLSTAVLTVSTRSGSSGSQGSSTPVPVPDNGATAIATGSYAALAGLAMVLLAL